MCGRYANWRSGSDLVADYEDLAPLFHVMGGDPSGWLATLPPRASIAPGTDNPIVLERLTVDGEIVRTVEPARWGLQPPWAKAGGPAPINARLETVTSNGMFRTAFARQRAIVPMTGYFEWTPAAAGRKQPWLVGSGEPLHAAGLYELRPADGGELLMTYAIITTEARDAAGEVHDRMPVFLTPDLFADWLGPDPLRRGDQLAMVEAIAAAGARVARTVAARPVSTRLNSTRTADPLDATLLDPIAPDSALLDRTLFDQVGLS